MNITEKTIEILQIEPDFVLKEATVYSSALTVHDTISKIIEDAGNSSINVLFKGHTLSKIRSVLTDLFMEYPKPSSSSEWYLHILSIHGLKKCPFCTEIKNITEFAKNKAMKSSGVDSWCLSCTAMYRDINSDKVKAGKAKHQKDNPEQYAFATAKRRAAKKQAIPTWADLNKIREIYENCPEGHHVDHWAPLQSDVVCGLHVESNLQYLKASENISKGNNFCDTNPYYGY